MGLVIKTDPSLHPSLPPSLPQILLIDWLVGWLAVVLKGTHPRSSSQPLRGWALVMEKEGLETLRRLKALHQSALLEVREGVGEGGREGGRVEFCFSSQPLGGWALVMEKEGLETLRRLKALHQSALLEVNSLSPSLPPSLLPFLPRLFPHHLNQPSLPP